MLDTLPMSSLCHAVLLQCAYVHVHLQQGTPIEIREQFLGVGFQLSCFEAGSFLFLPRYVLQASWPTSLLAILLFSLSLILPEEFWDYRYRPPHPAQTQVIWLVQQECLPIELFWQSIQLYIKELFPFPFPSVSLMCWAHLTIAVVLFLHLETVEWLI